MRTTATATIDLAALRANLAVVRALCPRSRIMAMVKANAYGHGLIPAARALADADGLAVARLQEALDLREAGITQRILLLGSVLDDGDLALCQALGIDVTAHDAASLAVIAGAARQRAVRVWLKLDSGMHRLGFEPTAFVEADRLLRGIPGVTELIHMTHFSSADDNNSQVMDRQLECFARCHRENPAAPVSLANSAALLSRPETHADWVRPGIMLYGGGPPAARAAGVRPVMTLMANVLAVRSIDVGESVGYYGRWTSRRRSKIATVGIGYGDGYPRHAPSGTPVWINGQRAPLVGRVSMDSIGVDVTECGPVAVGDTVVLWGPQLPASEVAGPAGTIDYALFTAVSPHVTRVQSEVARTEKPRVGGSSAPLETN